MKAVVTGAAGFIGSTLSERLVAEGHQVVGVDCFTPYYDAEFKRSNLEALLDSAGFALVQADLRECDLESLLEGADVVFHLAGQPGVRLSWADGFGEYASHNVMATQRLLEAAKKRSVRRVVYASSSSVYGNSSSYPTAEGAALRPHSPYGVTKLAAEHLCTLYADNWGLPTVSLRYFTVFGPRQRPDMAMHRLIEAALSGVPFPLYGNGQQIRDFTYVDDVVRATILAGTADVPAGTVLNVAGGSSTTMTDLIQRAASACDRSIEVRVIPAQPGDVERTGGTTSLAQELLGWRPLTDLSTGLARQVEWHRSRAAVKTLIRIA
jgi:nucleoside-diphosphate-sugar epimerase